MIAIFKLRTAKHSAHINVTFKIARDIKLVRNIALKPSQVLNKNIHLISKMLRYCIQSSLVKRLC